MLLDVCGFCDNCARNFVTESIIARKGFVMSEENPDLQNLHTHDMLLQKQVDELKAGFKELTTELRNAVKAINELITRTISRDETQSIIQEQNKRDLDALGNKVREYAASNDTSALKLDMAAMKVKQELTSKVLWAVATALGGLIVAYIQTAMLAPRVVETSAPTVIERSVQSK